MIRKTLITAACALGLGAGPALAAGGAGEVINYGFSFEGPFGSYDQMQLQRGLQVYTEVCAGCHGLKFVPIRTLADEGGPHLPEDQVRAYASDIVFEVFDPTLNDGQGDFRGALPTDNFPAVTSVGAPDLSLMAKARAGFSGPNGLGLNQLFFGMGGPEYIASLLTGYTGEEKTEAGVTLYENTAFSSGYISMGPPLFDGQVEYADGHEASVEEMAKDVAAFLMWTAEPKLNARKQAGLTGVIFLAVLSTLLYLTNKRLWAPHKGKKTA